MADLDTAALCHTSECKDDLELPIASILSNLSRINNKYDDIKSGIVDKNLLRIIETTRDLELILLYNKLTIKCFTPKIDIKMVDVVDIGSVLSAIKNMPRNDGVPITDWVEMEDSELGVWDKIDIEVRNKLFPSLIDNPKYTILFKDMIYENAFKTDNYDHSLGYGLKLMWSIYKSIISGKIDLHILNKFIFSKSSFGYEVNCIIYILNRVCPYWVLNNVYISGTIPQMLMKCSADFSLNKFSPYTINGYNSDYRIEAIYFPSEDEETLYHTYWFNETLINSDILHANETSVGNVVLAPSSKITNIKCCIRSTKLFGISNYSKAISSLLVDVSRNSNNEVYITDPSPQIVIDSIFDMVKSPGVHLDKIETSNGFIYKIDMYEYIPSFIKDKDQIQSYCSKLLNFHPIQLHIVSGQYMHDIMNSIPRVLDSLLLTSVDSEEGKNIKIPTIYLTPAGLMSVSTIPRTGYLFAVGESLTVKDIRRYDMQGYNLPAYFNKKFDIKTLSVGYNNI